MNETRHSRLSSLPASHESLLFWGEGSYELSGGQKVSDDYVCACMCAFWRERGNGGREKERGVGDTERERVRA